MFSMDLPWWEIPLRAAAVYLALLVMVRLSGKRTVGQFTPFDLLVVMVLGESVSNALLGGENSLTGGLLSAASLILLNGLVGWLSSRSQKLEDLVEGTPVLIGKDGQVFHDMLRRHRIGAGDMDKALREADCPLEKMRLAVLESDGNISIIRH